MKALLFNLGLLALLALSMAEDRGCPRGWKCGLGSCWLVTFGALFSWAEGRVVCKTIGGDLATIENMEQNNLVQTLLQESAQPYAWHGLHCFEEPKVFRKAKGGARISFENWLVGQPDNAGNLERCSTLHASNGRWNDFPCNALFPVICEKAMRTND